MKYIVTLVAFISILTFTSCSDSQVKSTSMDTSKKVGVLIVNHGSHSKLWRDMLKQVEENVKDSLMALPHIQSVKTAFMEYNEPSIATQMKGFDAEAYDEVIVVPLFLTVSSHYSHDIPVILGQKKEKKNVLPNSPNAGYKRDGNGNVPRHFDVTQERHQVHRKRIPQGRRKRANVTHCQEGQIGLQESELA